MKHLKNNKGDGLQPVEKNNLLSFPLISWQKSFWALAVFALLLASAGCPQGNNGDLLTVSLREISLPAPLIGEVPAAHIAETQQFTGTVVWNPAVSGTFAAATAYTATIALKAKNGYTLDGLPADFFVVEGATTANTKNTEVVASFPATALVTAPATDTVVYIAGYESEASDGPISYSYATLWVDGQPLRLSANGRTIASSVSVANDGTVYVAGIVRAPVGSFGEDAMLWTVRGSEIRETALSSSGGRASSVYAADNGTVYVAGSVDRSSTAVLWTLKGDEMTQTTLASGGGASSVYVTGDGTVYVVGNEVGDALLWTVKGNEVARTLLAPSCGLWEDPVGRNILCAIGVKSVHVAGDGTVYVAGGDGNEVSLWTVKGSDITTTALYDWADSVHVAGDGTAYVAGNKIGVGAMLWAVKENNISETALAPGTASFSSGARAVSVAGSGTVYVVGSVVNNATTPDWSEHATLWTLSGSTLTSQTLSGVSGDSIRVASVFVREKAPSASGH